jgi:TRAP transporter TAXI family solute receptor
MNELKSLSKKNGTIGKGFIGGAKVGLFILMAVTLVIALPPTFGLAKEVVLDCYTSEMGTDIYRFYFAPLDILQKAGSWVRLSTVETPGTQYNIEYLTKLDPAKKARTIINTSDTGYWLAREGKPPYTKKHTNLRILGGFSVVSSIWITLNPNVKKLPQDLIGKRIGIFPTKFAQAPYWDILIEKVWGIKDKAKFTRMFFAPAADALRDGLIDIILIGTTMGKGKTWEIMPALQEVSLKHKLYPLSLPKEDVEKVAKITGQPIRTQEIPVGTYNGQTGPANGMRIVTSVMACDVSLDEDIAYELIKTLGENAHRFVEHVPFGEHITSKFMYDLCPILDVSELHPGALKYYREKGFIK